MKKEEISKIIAERLIALSYKKSNRTKIDKLIEESKDESELIQRLKKAFPKFETIRMVHATVILPTGDITGCMGYIGEGVPRECSFTPTGFLKDWQMQVNRRPSFRKRLNIVVTDDRCPYCNGRIFIHEKHRWCNGFPSCKYEKEQLEKEIKNKRK